MSKKKERRYVQTFSELIDRLSIVQLKEVFIPEYKKEYAQEIDDIVHDIQLILDEFNVEKLKVLNNEKAEDENVIVNTISGQSTSSQLKNESSNQVENFLNLLAIVSSKDEIGKGINVPNFETELLKISYNDLKLNSLDQEIIFDGRNFYYEKYLSLNINSLKSVAFLNLLNKLKVDSPLSQINFYVKDNFCGEFTFEINSKIDNFIIKMSDLDIDSRLNLIVLIEKLKLSLKKPKVFDENILNEKDKLKLAELRKLQDRKIISEDEFNIRFKEITKKYSSI